VQGDLAALGKGTNGGSIGTELVLAHWVCRWTFGRTLGATGELLQSRADYTAAA
jgi:hypothetical protein